MSRPGEKSERSGCERGDSNPQAFRRQILSLVRLPVSPLSRLRVYTTKVTRVDRQIRPTASERDAYGETHGPFRAVKPNTITFGGARENPFGPHAGSNNESALRSEHPVVVDNDAEGGR